MGMVQAPPRKAGEFASACASAAATPRRHATAPEPAKAGCMGKCVPKGMWFVNDLRRFRYGGWSEGNAAALRKRTLPRAVRPRYASCAHGRRTTAHRPRTKIGWLRRTLFPPSDNVTVRRLAGDFRCPSSPSRAAPQLRFEVALVCPSSAVRRQLQLTTDH